MKKIILIILLLSAMFSQAQRPCLGPIDTIPCKLDTGYFDIKGHPHGMKLFFGWAIVRVDLCTQSSDPGLPHYSLNDGCIVHGTYLDRACKKEIWATSYSFNTAYNLDTAGNHNEKLFWEEILYDGSMAKPSNAQIDDQGSSFAQTSINLYENERQDTIPCTMLVSNLTATDGIKCIGNNPSDSSCYYFANLFTIKGYMVVPQSASPFYLDEQKRIMPFLHVWMAYPYNYHVQLNHYLNNIGRLN